jgi:hypothetical protein
MLQRIVIVVVTMSLLSGRMHSQTPGGRDEARVRVTASRAFEIPGVLKVDGSAVSGSSVTADDTTIRVVSPQSGQPLVILKPGVRRIGRAVAVNGEVVTLFLEGRPDPIAMPLSSIGKLEVSERRGERHVVRGILLGAGAFYGALALIFFGGCGLDCPGVAVLPAIAAGVVTGSIVGRSHESWQSVPTNWLLSNIRLQPAAAAEP